MALCVALTVDIGKLVLLLAACCRRRDLQIQIQFMALLFNLQLRANNNKQASKPAIAIAKRGKEKEIPKKLTEALQQQ